MSDPQQNFRLDHRGTIAYFATQAELEKAIEIKQGGWHAEFYQPGIGWVRYTPESKPVDYEAIIKRLVAAGEAMATLAWYHGVMFQERLAWRRLRDSAEIKKILGEA
jgi:hypothetical protein